MTNDKHIFDKALLWASGGGGFFVIDQLLPGNNIVTNTTNNEYRTISDRRYFYGTKQPILPQQKILIGHHWPTDILDDVIVNDMIVIKPGFITEFLLFIKRMLAYPDTIPNTMWLIRMVNRIENKRVFEDWNNFGHGVEVMHLTKEIGVFNIDYDTKVNNVNNMMYLFFVYCKSKGLVYTKENFHVFIEAMYKDHGYFKLQTDHSLLNNSSHPNIKNIDIIEYEEAFHTDYNLFGIDNNIKKEYANKNVDLMLEMLSIKDTGNKFDEISKLKK